MYADWLDEHGQPLRAEFIRVQCALKPLEHRPAEEQRQHVRLWIRNDEFLTQHRAELLGPLGAELTYFDVIFDRGFVSELRVAVPTFLRHAASVRAFRPAPRVRVTGAGRTNFGALLDCPELALVESVTTGDGTGAIGAPDAAELARCPYLGRLEVLELASNDIGDAGLERLAFSTSLPRLTELNASGNEITDGGLETLLGSPLWPRLRRLDLSINPLSDIAAELLAAAARTDLEHLSLRFTNIGPDGRMRLLRPFGGRVDLF
jgi:hypothetical protein